ncbi:MAG: RICIN domain-containing protein [Cyanobacteria bacterium P01_F01_bin.150]
MHDASNTKLKSSDDTYYSIKQKIVFQHRIGQQQIPLHVGFVGSNTILNDGIDLPNLCLSEKVDQIANQNLSFRLVCKKHPEKVLGLKNDLTSDNTSLELQDKRDSNDAQRWILKPGRLDGSYTIASKKDNNHVIDLPGKDTNPDKELKIFPKHTKKGGHYDDKNQDWQLKSAGDGYFYIVSGCVTSKQQQLTISVGSDGSRIQTVLLKNKAEQLWKLEVDEKKIKLRRNNLRLRIVNTLKESELIPERSQIDFDKDSRFIISFDTDPNLDSTNGHKKEEWMLGNQGQIDAITISLLDHSKDTWKFDDHDNRTIKPKGDQTIFRANKGIEIELSNIVTDYPTGTANMYIRYENIPGYWDGQFIVPIEKTPLVYRKDSIAMGTTSPEAYLHIKANDKTNDTFNRRNLAIFEANDLGNSNPVIIRGFQGETNALWIADNSTNIPTVAIDNLGKGSALDVAGSVSIFDDRSILDPSIFIDDQNGKKSGRNSLWVKSFANNKVDTSADKEYPTVWLENTGSASTLHVENSGTGDDKGLALEINGDTVFQKGSKIIGIPTLEFREFRTQAGKIDLKSDDVSAYKYRDIEYHQSFSGEIIQYCLMLTDWHIWCVDKEGKKVSNDFSLSEIKIGVYHHQINEKNKCQVDFNFRIGVGTTRDFKCDYAISLIALVKKEIECW